MDFAWLGILITGIFLGASAGYLGSLMLFRKMTIVVDPFSHLALPGVALALILKKDVSLIAFLFLFLGTILIWFLEQKTKLSTETIIAILFSTALAITFLFLQEDKLSEALVGDISKIGFFESIITILLSFFVFILVQKIYRELLLISISEDLALAEKINLKKYQFLYLLSISAIVALGVKFVGGLLVAGLIALPAASGKNWSKNLKTYKILSSFWGSVSCALGILAFKIFNWPAGYLIIIVSFFIFIISTIFRKKIKINFQDKI